MAQTNESSSRLSRYLARTQGAPLDPAAVAYLATLDTVEATSPGIARRIVQELRDQRTHLKLIASENYSSLAVQLAHGNLFTDKYAEGSIGHRFYAGCDNVDAIEAEAAELARQLFDAEHAYVQPHSGADAKPGTTCARRCSASACWASTTTRAAI
jgi:glycine hydroxymethyltransferase